MCELEKYSPEKRSDPEFLLERKNEFYPEEEFGDWAALCDDHLLDVTLYRLEKKYNELIE